MDSQKFNNRSRFELLKYLLYPLLGMLVFYANSQLSFNYFIKGYLSFIELQIAVIAIYFLSKKTRSIDRQKTRENSQFSK